MCEGVTLKIAPSEAPNTDQYGRTGELSKEGWNEYNYKEIITTFSADFFFGR